MSNAPYPGLRPFQRGETDIFFGREEQTDELVDRLSRTRFLSVVGPSGCGKSSLVRAGLLDALDSGFMAEAGAGWHIADMRPGSQPLRRLAEALLAISGQPRHDNDTAFLQAALERGPGSLIDYLENLPLPTGDNLLILVDQFEELFRFTSESDQDQADRFVALLLAATSQREHPVYVVITMRSDFIGDCARFAGLPEAVNEAQFLTPRLTREESREAIEGPAQVFGGHIEAVLVNRLLNDMGTDPDQLPLMQHALMRMWNRAQANNAQPVILTQVNYQSAGGLAKSLSNHADEAFGELNQEQQRIAEILFRALSERGTEQRDTRRPAPLQEVADVAGVSNEALIEVIEVFRNPERSFITPAAGVPLRADTVLDISHESLIRQWQRMKQWVEKESDSADIYQRLEQTARLWKNGQAALWTTPDLDYALEWRNKEQPTPAWAQRYSEHFDLAMEFLDTSKAEHEAEQQRQEQARQKELEDARKLAEAERQRAEEQTRSATRLKRLSFVLGLVVLIAIAAGLFAWNQSQLADTRAAQAEESTIRARAAEKQADDERKRTEASELRRTRSLFDSQLTHSALLARVEDYAAMKEVLQQTRELDKDIPASRRHARNLLARFGDIMGGAARQVYEGAGVPLFNVAVSPDGSLLAAVGENGTVVLFDVESGELLQRLEGHNNNEDVWDVVFHPQGAWLASAGNDQQIIRWSLPGKDTPAAKLQSWEAPDKVKALAISPDGKLLASGGDDNDISLWQAESGELVRRLEGHNERISGSAGLAFSPSGTLLASGSYDDTARLWNVETGETLQILRGHTDAVRVAFSPDGKHVATGSDDRRLALWDVESGQTRQVFTGHQNFVFGLDFVARLSATGVDITADEDNAPLLVSASNDRTLRVWDTDSGATLRILQGHSAGVLGIAVHDARKTEQGIQVFSASNDGTVRRWDIAPLPYQRLVNLPEAAISAAITPDGKYVAVGLSSGMLNIYSLLEMRLIATQAEAHSDQILRLSFSTDGRMLSSSSHDKTAKLWAFSPDGTLTEQQTFSDHTNSVHGLAFSPDSRILATASYDGRIGLFTIGTEEKRFIDTHEGYVNSIAFDDSGVRLLSAGYQDKTTRLWDITTDPPSLIKEFPKAQGSLLWATLSPDGQTVASVGRGSSKVQVYSTDDSHPLLNLIGHEQTVYRAIFSPDGRQLATVSSDATVRLWDLDTASELFTLHLPTNRSPPTPLWDFDFRCTPTGCWIAVPLTRGKLALYDFGHIYD